MPSLRYFVLEHSFPSLRSKAYDPANPKRDEIRALTAEVVGTTSEAIPENMYWAFSAYTLLIPQLLSYFSDYVLPQSDLSTPVWNHFDAVFQGLLGVHQLFDTKTHRPAATKAKGIVNLASSIQLMTLTSIGVTSLGPLAFVAGTGACFLISLDDSLRQLRRRFSPEYFLADSLAELDKIENLIDKKKASLHELTALPKDVQKSRSGRLAFKLALSSIKTLEAKRYAIQEQLAAKMDVALHEEGEESSLVKLTRLYKTGAYENARCRSFIEDTLKTRPAPDEASYLNAKKIDKRTTNKNHLAAFAAVSDSIMWALAFTGSLLVCIPGAQPAGLALIAAASILFLLKNSGKLLAKTAPPVSRFFKTPKPVLKEPAKEEGEGEKEKRRPEVNHD